MLYHGTMHDRNDEHSFTIGDEHDFVRFDGSVERGRLLYVYTRRVYATDDKGNYKKNDYRVGVFRCGYVPTEPASGVHSVHLGLGAFSIRRVK